MYASFAIYIGSYFFPVGKSGVDLVRTLLVFGVGFVVRPVGSLVFGLYADRAGRKAALTATIFLMGCGTALIAVAPSYVTIGVAAPLLLLAGRLLQGFSAGGEIGSAAALLIEHAPARRRGRYGAWLQASMGLSNILAALTALSVSMLPAEALRAWGWRLPFLLGLSIVPVGLYLRRNLPETPEFTEAREPRSPNDAPRGHAAGLFGRVQLHAAALAAGFGLSILWAVTVYVLIVYMPVFVQTAFGFTAQQAFGASLAENVLFVGGCLLFGMAADRIGHVRMLTIGALVLGAGGVPLFAWLDANRTPWVLTVVQSAFGLMAAGYVGVAPTVLASLFPTEFRATGISLTYNAAFVLFGGFAPAVLTWLTTTIAGTEMAPAIYLSAAAAVAVGTMLIRSLRRF